MPEFILRLNSQWPASCRFSIRSVIRISPVCTVSVASFFHLTGYFGERFLWDFEGLTFCLLYIVSQSAVEPDVKAGQLQ